MDNNKVKREKKKRRHKRVTMKIRGRAELPRLCLFKSNQHIYAQLIDDSKGEVLAVAGDIELKNKGKKNKTDLAKEAGKLIAKKALAKKIKKIVFDRGGYPYHGRVKALAEGAREEGLEF